MPQNGKKFFSARYKFLKTPGLAEGLRNIEKLVIEFRGNPEIGTETANKTDFKKEAQELKNLLGFFHPATLVELTKLFQSEYDHSFPGDNRILVKEIISSNFFTFTRLRKWLFGLVSFLAGKPKKN